MVLRYPGCHWYVPRKRPLDDPLVAHCDGLDGPVVKAAQRALGTGDVNGALVWVQARRSRRFERRSPKRRALERWAPIRRLADRYFFETLVRLHRAGEGEPYSA